MAHEKEKTHGKSGEAHSANDARKAAIAAAKAAGRVEIVNGEEVYKDENGVVIDGQYGRTLKSGGDQSGSEQVVDETK